MDGAAKWPRPARPPLGHILPVSTMDEQKLFSAKVPHIFYTILQAPFLEPLSDLKTLESIWDYLVAARSTCANVPGKPGKQNLISQSRARGSCITFQRIMKNRFSSTVLFGVIFYGFRDPRMIGIAFRIDLAISQHSLI